MSDLLGFSFLPRLHTVATGGRVALAPTYPSRFESSVSRPLSLSVFCVLRGRHCRSEPPIGTGAIRIRAANAAATATMIAAITSNAG